MERIRKINAQTSQMHSLITLDETSLGVLGVSPVVYGIGVSPDGTVFLADRYGVVWKVFENGTSGKVLVGSMSATGDRPSSGMFGDGGNDARLLRPFGICVDRSGNIFVSDSSNHKIYRMSSSGRSQTLSGTGSSGDSVGDNGLLCQFTTPQGIAVDKSGNVYVADTTNQKIKKIFPNGKVAVIAGGSSTELGFANGRGQDARFMNPMGICVDDSGVIYVMDTGNYRIRRIDESGLVTTLAGFSSGFVDGVGNEARFGLSKDICVDRNGTIFVLDFGNHALRRVDPSGRVSTMMPLDMNTSVNAAAIGIDQSGFLYVVEHVS